MAKIELMAPHAGQLAIYRNRGRANVLRCGRRFGKTSFFEWLMANWALNGDRTAYFAPHAKTFKDTFSNLLNVLDPAIKASSKTDGIITTKTKGKIDFWSMEDPRAGRGREYDHIVIDEASLIPDLENMYQQNVRPTLMFTDGDTWIGGTPLGITDDNYFHKICTNKGLPEKWTEHYAPTSANPLISRQVLAEYEASNVELVWQQEYLAQFTNWAGSAIFDEQKLLVDGRGVSVPNVCDHVFAVIDSAFKDGSQHDGTGVVICAKNFMDDSIVILDWDIVQIQAYLLVDWMPQIFERMTVWARKCNAIKGSIGAFIEEKSSGIVLLQAGRDKGWPLHPIEGKITAAGKDGRAIAASPFVHTEKVKITQEAYDLKRKFKDVEKNHLISQTCSYIIGDPTAAKRADDLADCFSYSCLIALGNNDGF